uniref:Amyloid beta precursor protein binding family A member 2 n=1 Tax=Esox lucius TaxID=8010 RepID=A0AAY5LA82_ESOLU
MAYGKKPGKITRILRPSPSSCPGLAGLMDKRPGTIKRILAPSTPPCPGSRSTKDPSDDSPKDLSSRDPTEEPHNRSPNEGLSLNLRSPGNKELDNNNDDRTPVPDDDTLAHPTPALPCQPQPQHRESPTSPGPRPRSRPCTGPASDSPFGQKSRTRAVTPSLVLAGRNQPRPEVPSNSLVHSTVAASVSSLNQPSDTTGPDSMDEDEEEDEEEDSCSEYDNVGSDREGLEQDVDRVLLHTDARGMEVRYSTRHPDPPGDSCVEGEDGLYVEHEDGTYKKLQDGTYVACEGRTYIEREDGTYVECEDGAYIEHKDGTYEEYEDGAYIEHEDGTYVRLEDGTYVEYEDGPYVEGEDINYLEGSIEGGRNITGQHPVPRPADGPGHEQMSRGSTLRQKTSTDLCTSPAYHHQFRDIPHQTCKAGNEERVEVEGEKETGEVEKGEKETGEVEGQEVTGELEGQEETGEVVRQEKTGEVVVQEVEGEVERQEETGEVVVQEVQGQEETEEERDVTTYSENSEETEEDTPSSHQGNGGEGTREAERDGERDREGERTRQGELMTEGLGERDIRIQEHTVVSHQEMEELRRDRQSQADCIMGNPGGSTTSRRVLESPQRTSCRVSGGGRDWTPQRAHKEVKRQGRGGRRDTRCERGGGRGGRETEREDGVGQMMSEVKVCMSSSSSSETQDGREAALRPRPPRPRPRPRPGPGNPHPHQADSHSQQAKAQSKTRPKQAYQTHTYLTEGDTDPAQAQNLELEAQSDTRQSQQTKAQDCGEDAIRPRPRSGPNTPHPHQTRPKQVHQTRHAQPDQNRKRQAPSHPTQAQASQDHTGKTRGHTQPTLCSTSTSDSPPSLQNQTQLNGTSTRSTSDSPPSLQNQAQLNGTSTRSTSDSPPSLQNQAQLNGTSTRSTSDSPPSLQNQTQLNGTSTRSTSDSPPSLRNQAQLNGISTRSPSDSPSSVQNQAELHGTSTRSISDSLPSLQNQDQLQGTSTRSTSASPPSKAQTCYSQVQQHDRESLVGPQPTSVSPTSQQNQALSHGTSTRPTSVSPPSHKAQVQDHTPNTRHPQHRYRESSARAPSDPPPFQGQLYQTETRTQEEPQREGPTSLSSDRNPIPEKHPGAVNTSPLPSPTPRYKSSPASSAPCYKTTPPSPAPCYKTTPPSPAPCYKTTPPSPAPCYKTTPPSPAPCYKTTPPSPAPSYKTTPPSPAPCYKVCPSPPAPPYKTSPAPLAPQRGTEARRESPERRSAQEQIPQHVTEEQPSRPPYPEPQETEEDSDNTPQPTQNNASFPSFVDVPGPCEPEDLIDGIIFAANYLGSTQLLSDKNPSKGIRMAQAHEAVSQVKSQDEDSQLVTEVDLFISTKAVKVLNADTQDTVFILQETLMDSALRTISYIADIGSIVVLMARTRRSGGTASQDCTESDLSSAEGQRQYRMICYVFESEDAQLIAQSIGQAFSVAYREFLRANGINPKDLSQKQYSDIINSQEMYNDDLVHFSNSDNCKELELEKQKGESLGVVIVESGWGSILPTVILANMLNSGPAARSGKLNVGDQIMSINNTSLVGLPLATCQSIIKGLKSQVQVKLSIVSCPPVTTVLIKRPDLKFQLGFSVQNGIICSLMRGGIAERGGVRVGHRIIEINGQSVVAMPHEKIVQTLSISVGEINMKTMPAVMFRLLTGQETPVYI